MLTDLNPIEQGFNEYKTYLKTHHDDPDIADHQYITQRAFNALSPKMHTHFDSCGLDAKDYFTRLAERKVADEVASSVVDATEDLQAILALSDLCQ